MRIRTIVTACSTLVLLTALAACAGAAPSAPAPSTVVHPTTGVPATESVATAASFRADLTIQRAGLGLLALTNAGQQPVTVQGWPTLEFRNAADEYLAVPIRKVNVPGAGPSITIAPGRTAFAGVRWATGDKAAANTFVATSIRLTPPGGTQSVNVDIIDVNGHSGGYVEFDITSAQVGTLQPAAQGVLVF
jgi:hypothetical protein